MKILRSPQGNLSRSLFAIFLAIFGYTHVGLAQVGQEVVLDGPFAYWTMNETGPGPATNAGTSSAESANYLDNGQLEFGVEGLADANATAVRFLGFNFDDPNNSAGTLDIADSADSNAGGPWLEKTIELWFSVDDANSTTEQVIYEQGGSTRGMSIYVRGGKVYAGAHNSAAQGPGSWPAGVVGAGESELAVVSTNIESNTPYHLAMVFQGSAVDLGGTIKGYLNGAEFGETDNIGELYAHTDDIRVGGPAAQAHFDLEFSGATPFGNDSGIDGDAPTPQAPYYFTGVIDDLALYNTALTAERIKAHFDAREYLPGDFDSNGTIDLVDFAILADHLNQDGLYADGDMSFDGHVNLEDFSRFRRAYAAVQGGAAATAVPEPSSQLLCLCIAIALPLLRRRRNR